MQRTDFPLFTPDRVWTDDTVLTVATADALLSGMPYDRADRTWARRHPHAGYGGTFRRWFRVDDAAAALRVVDESAAMAHDRAPDLYRHPMPTIALPIPLWQAEGFAAPPELLTATADLTIYRVTGHASTNPTGNCFFVPAVADVDVRELTAIELEYNLNAGIWGNGFQRLHTFAVRPGVRYWRGPVAHAGLVGRTAPYARFEPPAGRVVQDRLRQVVLVRVEAGTDVVKGVLANLELPSLLTERGAPRPVPGAARFVAQGDPSVRH